jgi:ubiquinone/menaquinone biosynthesis C-methylase UbiE
VTPSPPVAYAVDQFESSSAELERLKQQALLIAAAEEDAFRGLGLPETGRVLDLGCGPGFVAARILARRPRLDLLGVDRDPLVLGRAREHVRVIEADAERLPFSSERFDCVYARLVLRHLPRPAQVLRDVHRILRPGGRVIVLDTDDGALVLQPWPDAFGRALAARQQTFRRRGADPFLGRRLPALLRQAGFDEIGLRTLVVDSVSVGLGAFTRIVLSPIVDAIDEDLLGRAEMDESRASMESWAATDDAFGMTTVIVVGGTRR